MRSLCCFLPPTQPTWLSMERALARALAGRKSRTLDRYGNTSSTAGHDPILRALPIILPLPTSQFTARPAHGPGLSFTEKKPARKRIPIRMLLPLAFRAHVLAIYVTAPARVRRFIYCLRAFPSRSHSLVGDSEGRITCVGSADRQGRVGGGSVVRTDHVRMTDEARVDAQICFSHLFPLLPPPPLLHARLSSWLIVWIWPAV
ncbi:hypothetical protein CALCODRAFT_72823 [Calocera cornea HHB12733]|uniref:Uncharacterized protein n=1 Tax=Calocera cornea HHB12733 TaxID=1353952 RepID=A0A165ITM8_9BASI|nr:hypothetical protein CALCODRAFT_72823 [Calocera cornea HHB12733]